MNPRRLHPFLWALFFVLIEFAAYPCGPDWPVAVFVQPYSPDAPYDSFAQGHLGVPQLAYGTRHLVIVYRYLSGLPLSTPEQAAAVKADTHFNASWDSGQQNPQQSHPGFFAWIAARISFGPVDNFTPGNPFTSHNTWQYDSYFENCLDDAFATATRTLQSRISSNTPHSPEVTEWVRGQDAVFNNCNKENTAPALPPGTPTPAPRSTTVNPLPSSAPQWLRDDRAYQLAAAQFYQHDYEAAPPTDPAYPAVMYHRLRLSPADPATRNQLLAVLPNLAAHQTPSTRNLFAELNARTAPDLTTWLQQAARIPASESHYGIDDGFDQDNKPTPQPCGPALRDTETPLFPADAATILNTRLPLRLLAQAAQSSALPPNLRFQVAQSAWTRAVLLDRRDLAARLSPILIACNSNWRPVLSAYDRAVTPKDRRATALFALMRFASTEPTVREGTARPEGFATYSQFRDNWWCFTIPLTQVELDSLRKQNGGDYAWGFTSLAHSEVPDPLFLTPEDRAEAAKEIAALRAIPKAAAYLPAQALAFQRANPKDPRSSELIGQAFRVVRNACTDKTSTETEHQLFLTLHNQYPSSPWTARYKTWE